MTKETFSRSDGKGILSLAAQQIGMNRDAGFVVRQLEINGCVKIMDENRLLKFLKILKADWWKEAYHKGRVDQERLIRENILGFLDLLENKNETQQGKREEG